jgi:hypothetical protein
MREVTAPSGKKVLTRVTFGAEFFRPFFWVFKRLIGPILFIGFKNTSVLFWFHENAGLSS